MILPLGVCGAWVMTGLLAVACLRGLLWEAWRRGDDLRPGEGDTGIEWCIALVGPVACLCLLAVCLMYRIAPRWAHPPAKPYETVDAAIARLERDIACLDAQSPHGADEL